ncbi:MAG: T9SS type A sorting domain-containing protein [Candidatus Eisenbacteria bacterium]|nr:T9SS type A sorting domain-containing protein [Candidatus Latescibacterota bacterium]MBD3302737.1 T9SS type A sorting domain-containing protein [Candidatus Eisenbacteria bacterium]
MSSFGDWPTEYQVCGDPTWHTEPMEIDLPPDQACEVAIRVTTDGSIEKRTGSFQVTSHWSTRAVAKEMRVFNGSWAILFVDDDRDQTDEIPILAALDANSLLYDHWDINHDHGGNSPTLGYMADYDQIVWHNSWWPTTAPLSAGDVTALMSYVDGGGSLFLTSQLFLADPEGPANFITDYLGVESYTVDPEYEHLDGVVGDPIGDGLSFDLDFPFSALRNGDAFTPTATATACMTEPGGMTVTAANDIQDAGKVVFMAVAANAIPAEGADPNNLTEVMGRIMEWLEPQVPADVDDPVAVVLGSRIDGARPNPFNPRTEIDFRLSRTGASGPVRVEIFDLAGRKIARLFEGSLTAGPHTVTWTGTADGGQPVESGVYFVRLNTREGWNAEKLILLK